MTPTEIKAALAKLGGHANKRLGQHFLIDRAALETIVEAANIKAGDRVLEIGPGLGVLTRALIEKGAEVIGIEQDRRFVEYLVGAHGNAPLQIIHGDAATTHWHELIADRPWKFVSNLPYSITSLALRKALWTPKPPDVVVALVQREVAERAIARDGKTSLLSLMVALASESARIVRRVPPGAFFPPPKVESAVLQIVPMSLAERERKWGMDPEKIMAVAKKGFAHPRKLLSSNLGLRVGTTHASSLQEIGINPKARAEDLAPEDWARLGKLLTSS